MCKRVIIVVKKSCYCGQILYRPHKVRFLLVRETNKLTIQNHTMNWVKNACTKMVKLCNSNGRFMSTIISSWGKDEDIITKKRVEGKKKKKIIKA